MDDLIAETFSEYFLNIPNLNITPNHGYKYSESLELDPILRIIGKYRDHTSTKLIKVKNNSWVFNFTQENIEEVKKETYQNLDIKKASQKDVIKTKLPGKNANFLQSTHVIIFILQFVLQIFQRINSCRDTSA